MLASWAYVRVPLPSSRGEGIAMFHVGQLVQFIGTADLVAEYSARYPGHVYTTPGGIYTVRGKCAQHDRTLLLLREIDNSHSDWNEPGFNSKYFRPVDEDRLAVFRRIAASPKERIRIGEEA